MEILKKIGPYELLEEIGRGGMSIVYKANHPTLSKMVAVKVLSPSLSQDAKFKKRFKNEAQLLASLRHQNIVNILDFGEENKEYYLVLDFIEGNTVRQMIKDAENISIKVALNIINNVASGISYTHRKGIIHRDLKSSNIMIDQTGRILVTDFGLSKDISLKKIPETTMEPNEIVGTLGYIAPEQLDPKIGNIDERTDIYSLGVIFYELLTGRLPFDEKNAPINVAYMHLSVIPESPMKFNKDLFPKAEQVVMKMLEKDPGKRYQNCEELIEAIHEMEEIAKYYREGSIENQGSFFEIVSEDQSFSKSVEEFNKTFEKKDREADHSGPKLLEGKIIQKRYRLDKLILKRILSNLYAGYDLMEQQQVTVQVPNNARPSYQSRLEKEIETMKAIDHSSFVQFLDIVQEEKVTYIIREHVEGRSIKNMIENETIPIDQAVTIVLNILEGLSFLHEKKMSHSDINSDVIMVAPDLKVKITALGIAKVEDASSVSSGEFLGIVQYTAPEQITQSHSDARSDVYSVGILLFELLAGKPPFTSSLPVDVMDMHLKKVPRFPDLIQNQIPLNLQRIVLKALSKSPDQRYQDAKEFCEELMFFAAKNIQSDHPDQEMAFEGGFDFPEGADPELTLYQNIMETSANTKRKISFSIKKNNAKDKKMKQKMNINSMITEIIQPEKDPEPRKTNPSKTSRAKNPKLLVPLLLIFLVLALSLLFYPDISRRIRSGNTVSNPDSAQTTLVKLKEDQATVFPSFEPFEVAFVCETKVKEVVINHLPSDIRIISSIMTGNVFKAVLYSEFASINVPFSMRLLGTDEDGKEVFQRDFVFTVLNRSLTQISFVMGNDHYQKTTFHGSDYHDFEILPFFHQFNIYLPLRFIVETFDGLLEYDFSEEMITIKGLGEETYRFYLYQDKYYVGEDFYKENPILETEDRAYLPIYLFAEKKGLHTMLSSGEDGKTLVTMVKVR